MPHQRPEHRKEAGHVANPILVVRTPETACSIMYVTGYDYTGNPTRSGRWPRVRHTIAADWQQIPAYTWVHIVGLGTYQVEDTGGAIGWNRLDVYVASAGEAYALTGSYTVCWPTVAPVG